MGAIISDVFGGLEVALRKINDAAIALPPVHKIIDNVVLVFFTNHIIEDYNFLVVSGQHLKRNNIVGAFNNIIPSRRIDSFIEIINHILVLVLMQVLCAKVNFVVDQQPVKHMHENICFTRVARPANKHPKGICWHTRVALLVITFCSQTGVVIWNFHFFFCYIYGKNMSMKKWRKLVSEKAEVEQQNDSILAAIKNNKIEKEFGQLSGEELFKPITSRLDKLQVGAAPKEEEEIPDYGMDEFDLNNPFDEDFKPDEETPLPTPTPSPTPSPTPTPTSSPPPSPTSTPPPSPSSTPLPPLAEEEEMELTASPEEKPSKWGPPQEPGIKGSESVDLQTLSSMLTKNKDNPDYVVKSPKSKFRGYTLADIRRARDEILDRRKGNKQPSEVLPKGVEAAEREMEGSGSVDPNALVERLYISLASIQAGNTSLKLKKQVKQILGLLVRQNEITEKQAHKILSNII